jgi:hypothetical protein
MSETAGVIVEWEKGRTTGFASRQDAERFIKRICRKTAPKFDYYIYSTINISFSTKKNH